MDLSILIEKLPTILVDFPEISLVYLFGSRVDGQIGPLSDYDIAIYTGSREDGYLTQVQFQHALVQLLSTDRVDVVLLDNAPIELSYHIIASGKLLYQKDCCIDNSHRIIALENARKSAESRRPGYVCRKYSGLVIKKAITYNEYPTFFPLDLYKEYKLIEMNRRPTCRIPQPSAA